MSLPSRKYKPCSHSCSVEFPLSLGIGLIIISHMITTQPDPQIKYIITYAYRYISISNALLNNSDQRSDKQRSTDICQCSASSFPPTTRPQYDMQRELGIRLGVSGLRYSGPILLQAFIQGSLLTLSFQSSK